MRPERQFRPSLSPRLEDRLVQSQVSTAAIVREAVVAAIKVSANGKATFAPPKGPGTAEILQLDGSGSATKLGKLYMTGQLSTNRSVPTGTQRTSGIIRVKTRSGELDFTISGPITDLSPSFAKHVPLNFQITGGTGALAGATGTGSVDLYLLRTDTRSERFILTMKSKA